MTTASGGKGHTAARRSFLADASALAAVAFLGPRTAAAEPPPETTRIRLITDEVICLAPQFLSAELLRLEGFTDIEYVPVDYEQHPNFAAAVAAGKADLSQDGVVTFVAAIDSAQPLTVLAGVHLGCWELFAGPRVNTIRDLKGKRIPIVALGAEEHLLTLSMLAYLGMDPRKDVTFVQIPSFDDQIKAFQVGSIDAIFAFPPQPQRLRAKGIGRVIVDTARDKPWSQYYCCLLGGNRDFVTRNPVAAKRAVRAILKAADVCSQDAEGAARSLVAKGHEPRYETALEVVQKVSYGRWRDVNPEDALRFHALRLHEAGMIKSNPNKLIAQGTDWRIFNELKRELKA